MLENVHSTHTQGLIRIFAPYRYMLQYQMILAADSKDPDQVWSGPSLSAHVPKARFCLARLSVIISLFRNNTLTLSAVRLPECSFIFTAESKVVDLALDFVTVAAICFKFCLVSFRSCIFSVLLALRLPRLGKRHLTLVLFVRLFDLRLFGFVCFLFLLVSGKDCGLWLWHSLDFYLNIFEQDFIFSDSLYCEITRPRSLKTQISEPDKKKTKKKKKKKKKKNLSYRKLKTFCSGGSQTTLV